MCFFFFFLIYSFIEEYPLYRILFSVKPQRESAIGIHISPPCFFLFFIFFVETAGPPVANVFFQIDLFSLGHTGSSLSRLGFL